MEEAEIGEPFETAIQIVEFSGELLASDGSVEPPYHVKPRPRPGNGLMQAWQ